MPKHLLKLKKNINFLSSEIHIPGSKSESNRALIISALEGNNGVIQKLGSARDTQTMKYLLESHERVQNVLDAGTTMRFLTGYYAVANESKQLTGTERMQKRPIKILVDALREIGCNISYLNEEGFPPLEIKEFKGQLTDRVSIPGNVSSQYISALLMIAPILPKGLTLELTGKLGSRPYIQMTLDILRKFGVQHSWIGDEINVPNQTLNKTTFIVEADWSGASYWYAFASLGAHNGILLKGLKEDSFQGDRVIAEIMVDLGIQTAFISEGAYLTKSTHKSNISIDFTDIPDLAQTIAVICAAKQIEGTFTGLESLKIKETDRILALQNELAKLGCVFKEITPANYSLTPSQNKLPDFIEVETYDDHRMAMAFAPLAMKMDVSIHEPDVVKKSYPEYWDEVKKAGIEIT